MRVRQIRRPYLKDTCSCKHQHISETAMDAQDILSPICRFCIFVVRNAAYAHAARHPLGIAREEKETGRALARVYYVSATRKRACWEEKMLLPFSTLVLASQTLVLASQPIIAVAGDVPRLNIERGCKVDSTATSLDVGLDESIKRCVHDEQQARDQFQTQWSQFASSDRVMCTTATTDIGGVPPSYVELRHVFRANSSQRS
jgi:hypothetical protein